MRLRARDKRAVHFRERIPAKEPDGTPYEDWAAEGVTIRGSLLPAGGKIMAELYGERLNYMMVLYVEHTPEALQLLEQFNGQKKGYAACIYVPSDAAKPDYRVVAMRPWQHLVIELEKV
ncbi:MAG: hypothetical protein K6T85_02830 [Gorillibacterium sp.]|nr:hypothetical protein [Gorillibacterium sp.]